MEHSSRAITSGIRKNVIGLIILLLYGFLLGYFFHAVSLVVFVALFTIWWYSAYYWLVHLNLLFIKLLNANNHNRKNKK